MSSIRRLSKLYKFPIIRVEFSHKLAYSSTVSKKSWFSNWPQLFRFPISRRNFNSSAGEWSLRGPKASNSIFFWKLNRWIDIFFSIIFNSYLQHCWQLTYDIIIKILYETPSFYFLNMTKNKGKFFVRQIKL